MKIKSVDDAAAAVRNLAFDLERAGRSDLVAPLTTALTDFHSSSTEALIAYYEAILQTRQAWTELSQSKQHEAGVLAEEIRRLMNLR
jgi:hypothetical protein